MDRTSRDEDTLETAVQRLEGLLTGVVVTSRGDECALEALHLLTTALRGPREIAEALLTDLGTPVAFGALSRMKRRCEELAVRTESIAESVEQVGLRETRPAIRALVDSVDRLVDQEARTVLDAYWFDLGTVD